MELPAVTGKNSVELACTVVALFLKRLWYLRKPFFVMSTVAIPALLIVYYAPRIVLEFWPMTVVLLANLLAASRAYRMLPESSTKFERYLIEDVRVPRPGDGYRRRVRALLEIQLQRYEHTYAELTAAIQSLSRAAAENKKTADPKSVDRKKRYAERKRRLVQQLNELTRKHAQQRGNIQELIHISESMEGDAALQVSNNTEANLISMQEDIEIRIKAEAVRAITHDERGSQTSKEEKPEEEILPMEPR